MSDLNLGVGDQVPANPLGIYGDNGNALLIIGPDGKMRAGEGLSLDEATQEAAKKFFKAYNSYNLYSVTIPRLVLEDMRPQNYRANLSKEVAHELNRFIDYLLKGEW